MNRAFSPVISGSWARKMRIARAFTNPVTTERETKRMSTPSLKTPGRDLEHPGEEGGGEQVLEPVLPSPGGP
jgi:hypothetical protein